MDSVPQVPQTPCTEMAPTGSSILILSKNITEPTTIAPAIAPMRTATDVVTVPQGAVIATRPASRPLAVIETSGLLVRSHMTPPATTAPAQAATRVRVATIITNSSAASSEPGLNPNQPMNRMSAPSTTSGMLWPGMARALPSDPYLPMRGPSMMAPMSAAQPPVPWTTVEPAKSLKGNSRWASQPPPHVQRRITG